MPTDYVVSLLIAERDKLTLAIEALQGPTKRRGRPPKNSLVLATVSTATPEPLSAAPEPIRKKRTFTAAQRKAFGERMKKYWAAKRKAEAKAASKPKAVAKKKAKAA
ncbi:MAG: hypothetical protein ABSB35_41870 [Bryobacteraceae bacterium]|jgi:hypothetical protein